MEKQSGREMQNELTELTRVDFAASSRGFAAYRCLSLLIVACRCLALQALPTVACRCLSLPRVATVAYCCLSLPSVASVAYRWLALQALQALLIVA